MIRKAGIMPTVFELAKNPQTSCQKEERFTVQNKLTDGSPSENSPEKQDFPFDTKAYVP